MAATAPYAHLFSDPGEMTMPWETILGAAIGGLFTLLGSIVALRHQGKLQDGRFAYEQQKAKEEWERQEGGEERKNAVSS